MSRAYLKCNSGNHPPIEIGTEWIFVGRSRETKIKDVFCARNQIKVKANFEEGCLMVLPLGENESALNGLQLERNKLCKAYHGDVLEILFGKYFHSIVFDVKQQTASGTEEDSLARIKNLLFSPPEDDNIAEVKKNKVEDVNDEPSTCSSWESIASYDIDEENKIKIEDITDEPATRYPKEFMESLARLNKVIDGDNNAKVEDIRDDYTSEHLALVKKLIFSPTEDLTPLLAVHNRKRSQQPDPNDDNNAEAKKIKVDDKRDEQATCSSFEESEEWFMVCNYKGICASKKMASYDIDEENKIEIEDLKDEPATCSSWENSKELMVYTSKGICASKKIASYDIDGTITKTKYGKVFPIDYDDWELAFHQVAGKLKDLHKSGFKIVFFTNQAGMSKGKTEPEQWKKKLERILKKLNVPVQVFVSTSNGIYRKPRTGMWDTLEQKFNSGIEICKQSSFYVGDAAGRPEKKGPPKIRKDHSLADRLFALNLGITFATPEEHFQNKEPENWIRPLFEPAEHGPTELLSPVGSKLVSGKLEVIVMVGRPGSGKSKFAESKLAAAGYAIVNTNTLKTMEKCLEALQDSIRLQKSVVVDNTNPDAGSRKAFIAVAKKLGVMCRCFVMAVTLQHSKHNHLFRDLTDSSHVKVSDIVINTYNKKYEEPKLSEGFTEIVKVNFLPTFENKTHEQLYKLYLLDK